MDKPWKRRKKTDLQPLKDIIILMAVNNEFLRSISPLLDDMSFLPNAPFLHTVIRWTIKYFNKYNRAPREYLDKIFNDYKEEIGEDEPEIALIAKFLSNLNERYLRNDFADVDVNYELEKAEKLLQSYALTKNANDVLSAINAKAVEEAMEIRKSFEVPTVKMIERPPSEIMEEKAVCSDAFIKEVIGEPQKVIEPWLSDGSITMLFSPRGVGKTWVCLIIAASITRERISGLKIGNWRVVDNAGVLYIDGEMSEYHLQRRLKHLVKGRLGRENPNNPLTILSSSRIAAQYRQQIRITDPRWRETIYDFLAKNDQYQLMVLDNLASLAGGLDENDKKSWDPINEWLLSLRHLNVAVLFVHHAGKSGQQRGTSGREDNVDNIIKLEKDYDVKEFEPDSIFIKIKFSKARNIESSEIYPFGLKIFDNRRQRSWDWETYEIKDKNEGN